MWRVSAVMARHRIHFAPPSLRCPRCGGRAQGLLYHSTYQTRGHRRDTLRRWRRRAVPRARAVDEEFVTDLCVTDLELDEQWSFAGRKKAEFADSAGRGEAWWHKIMAWDAG